MPTNDIEILKKALERERKARQLAESIVENRLRELYFNNIQLSNTVLTQEQFQNDLLDNLVDPLFVIDFNGEILKINKDNFTEYVNKYSEDPGSKSTGGVYENFLDFEMVPQFSKFAVEKPIGTIGMVTTDFGIHIIEVPSGLRARAQVKHEPQ